MGSETGPVAGHREYLGSRAVWERDFLRAYSRLVHAGLYKIPAWTDEWWRSNGINSHEGRCLYYAVGTCSGGPRGHYQHLHSWCLKRCGVNLCVPLLGKTGDFGHRKELHIVHDPEQLLTRQTYALGGRMQTPQEIILVPLSTAPPNDCIWSSNSQYVAPNPRDELPPSCPSCKWCILALLQPEMAMEVVEVKRLARKRSDVEMKQTRANTDAAPVISDEIKAAKAFGTANGSVASQRIHTKSVAFVSVASGSAHRHGYAIPARVDGFYPRGYGYGYGLPWPVPVTHGLPSNRPQGIHLGKLDSMKQCSVQNIHQAYDSGGKPTGLPVPLPSRLKESMRIIEREHTWYALSPPRVSSNVFDRDDEWTQKQKAVVTLVTHTEIIGWLSDGLVSDGSESSPLDIGLTSCIRPPNCQLDIQRFSISGASVGQN
ncbi:hypothetical protein C8F01DRAFT_1083433 [Mycena amicta]|nr:hypothetical protein C8F01DRAFT_1083433 [Mycena amicta]